MKKSFYGVLAFAALIFTACGENETVVETTEEAKEEIVAETYTLNASESTLNWEGSWIGGQSDGKTHDGIVNISAGTVTKTGDDIEGSFTVDMTSIDVQDIDEAAESQNYKDTLQVKDRKSVV